MVQISSLERFSAPPSREVIEAEVEAAALRAASLALAAGESVPPRVAASRAAASPWPPARERTLGALLERGGGWLLGLRCRRNDVELTLSSAGFRRYDVDGASTWIEYGVTLDVRGVQHALFVGATDSVVQLWRDLPTSDAAKPAVLAVLQRVLDEVADGHSIHYAATLDALLVAAIEPPAPTSLWSWAARKLSLLLVGRQRRLAGCGVTVGLVEMSTPSSSLVFFGDCGVTLAVLDDERAAPESRSVSCGAFTDDALRLRGPHSAAEEHDLEAIVARFSAWLDAELDALAARRVKDDHATLFFEFTPYFPLLPLLEQRMKYGAAGAPPVPLFDEAAIARAASLIQPVRDKRAVLATLSAHLPSFNDEHMLAVFDVDAWTIVLCDDTRESPFGSDCAIVMLPPDFMLTPEVGAPFSVMRVDAWNPPRRLVVDGDAFAFGRFLTWLRQAILRAHCDTTLTFTGPERDEEPAVELQLSDWLLFGEADVGDRFLVDWRAQHHVVNAVTTLDELADDAAVIDKLRTYDRPLWRRFLREVIDARFVHTMGERRIDVE